MNLFPKALRHTTQSLFVVLLSSISSNGLAQVEVVGETIIVTASRLPQPQSEIPENAELFDSNEIRSSPAPTVDGLLRQIPGFTLFRRSSSLASHPTAQGATLRGIGPSGSSRTLVLLDGIPLNDPFGGWVYWNRLASDQLQQIEVTRGAGSGVWGSAALGGVINLSTQPIEAGIRASASGGDPEFLEGSVTVGTIWDHSAADFSVSGRDSNGYFVISEAQRGQIDEPVSSRHQQSQLRFEHDFEHSTLGLRAGYFEENRGNGTALTDNQTTQKWASAHWALTADNGDVWQATAQSQWQDFASRFSAQAADRNSERPALDQFDVPSTSHSLSLQWSGQRQAQEISAGLDVRLIDGETNEDFRFVGNRFQNRRRAGATQHLIGLFVQDSVTAFNQRLFLSLAGRFDHWANRDAFRRDVNQISGATLRNETANDRSRNFFNGKIGLRLDASESISLRALAYRGFRAPTINELVRPFRVRNDITEANANLEPETLLGAEIGIDFSAYWRDTLIESRFTVFDNRLDNAIANVTIAQAAAPGVISPCGFVPAGGSCRQRQNLASVKSIGVEWDTSLTWAERWTVSARSLYNRATVQRAVQRPDLEGRALPQTPKWSAVLAVHYQQGNGKQFRLQSRLIGSQFEDDQNQRKLSGYGVVDFYADTPINPQWTAFVRAENVLDREFSVGLTASGLETIGQPQQIFLGLRWQSY